MSARPLADLESHGFEGRRWYDWVCERNFSTIVVAAAGATIILLACTSNNSEPAATAATKPTDAGTDQEPIETTTDASIDSDADADACVTCGDGGCIDTTADPSNYGQCAHKCGAGYACTSGKCGNDVVQVATTTYTTFAVLHDGSVWSWGGNGYGELGVEREFAPESCSLVPCRHTPMKAPDLAGVVELRGGSESACARTSNGGVVCWGINARSQLGPNGGAGGATPRAIPFPSGLIAAKLAVGSGMACIVSTGGEIYCWGGDRNNSFGDPDAGDVDVATPQKVVALGNDVTSLEVEFSEVTRHVCAVRGASKTAWCWGYNAFGSTGHSQTNAVVAPGAVIDDAGVPFTGVDSIAVGDRHTCALRAGGTVWCWGSNHYSVHAATPDVDDHVVPRQIGGLSGVVDIDGRLGTVFAKTKTGSVYGWGLSHFGRLGSGALVGTSCGVAGQTCVSTPTPLPGLANAVQISLRFSHGAALMPDGTVETWGLNDTAQLGHSPGAAPDMLCAGRQCNPTPTTVAGLP